MSQLYGEIYDLLQAPVARFDCGQKCAPLNGGTPVCCSADNAIPVMAREEYRMLRGRSELWRPYRARTAAGRKVVKELHSSCIATECKGAAFCERDNRSLCCRAFPFFPYITRGDAFVGLGYYWSYEDRCWVISNLKQVDRQFVAQFVAAFERLFAEKADERKLFRDYSAGMRRVFSRRQQFILLIGRDCAPLKVLPYSGRVVSASVDSFPAHGPYRAERREARRQAAAG